MDILSLIGWRTAELEKAADPGLPALKIGDRLQGRVARLLHRNLAVVELLDGRFKAVAELKTPLDPGQRLDLEVTATTPRLTLQTLSAERSAVGGMTPGGAETKTGAGAGSAVHPETVLRLLTPRQAVRLASELRTLARVLQSVAAPTNASGAGPVSSALERLAGHLTALDPQADPKETASQLQARVRDGGLLFEQKLVEAALWRGPGPTTDPPPGMTAERKSLASDGRAPLPMETKAAVDGKLPANPEVKALLQAGARSLAPTAGEPAAARTDTGTLATNPQAPAAAAAPEKTPLSPQLLNPLQSDLKPQLQHLLLQLPALMEGLDPEQRLSAEGARHLWATVAALLEEIDSGQTRLVRQHSEEPPAVMRHAMWVEGRETPLKFNVYLPRKRGRRGDATATPMISLLLDLNRFGALRVDVRERQGGVRVNLWAESAAAMADLQGVSAPLAVILESLYPQVDLEIALSPDDIAAFDREDGTLPVAGAGNRRLDIRI